MSNTPAERLMRELNPKALIGRNAQDVLTIVEDIKDPDGRWYRVRYEVTDDARHGLAFCVCSPWPKRQENYADCHLANDGFICVGAKVQREMTASPYDLTFLVLRTRYWCIGYSYYREHGRFPQPGQN